VARAWSDRALAGDLERRLQCAADAGFGLSTRFALLTLDLTEDELASLVKRANVPSEHRDVARVALRERAVLGEAFSDADAVLALLERADAFRRAERLDRLLEVAACDAGCDLDAFAPATRLRNALRAAKAVDAGAIAREHPDDVPGAVRRAREVAIAQLQPPTGH
jgi:tRNA nucleotidyltransferase (CCA-adding enzyme)